MRMTDRRDFIKSLLAGGGGLLWVSQLGQARAFESILLNTPGDDPWFELPQILARIKAPTFPKRDFHVTKFGARGDGKFDCTGAIRRSIDACSRAGGGRVVVPAG